MTTADLFHLINEFGKIKYEIVLYLVDDYLQESTSDTCGIFQLHFHIFQSHFSLDRDDNESIVKTFAREYDITRFQNKKTLKNMLKPVAATFTA